MSELGTMTFGLIIIFAAVGGAAVLTWFERRLLGVWQDRHGPNRLGPLGILQVAADMIKLLTKDDWIPPFSDKPVFVFAPTAIVVAMMLGFAVIPFGPDLYVLDINIGLLFFLGMTSRQPLVTEGISLQVVLQVTTYFHQVEDALCQDQFHRIHHLTTGNNQGVETGDE